MREYIRNMKVPFILIAVLLVIYGAAAVIQGVTDKEYTRGNNECPQQRVFDYADKLTDSEEEKLEALIEKRESQIGCDIVLVILNEPLQKYAESYADQIGYVTEDKYVMVYADNFYDENNYGFDSIHGDGCIFVDNWDRTDSSYGYAYNWLSTSGTVFEKYSESMIRDVIDDVNEEVNDDPYEAYRTYVEDIYRTMSGHAMAGMSFPFIFILIAAAVVTVIFIVYHFANNKGRRTTSGTTYVNGGKPKMNRMQDLFITKHVTKRHIESNNGGGGSGGGGGHVSAGGVSHGGGGGHH